ncbi:MAG: hypothetical protein MJY51_00985, partial [Bacteroidales bacterium]|nr:hypothetical protein [Bacteroidales bacterium]
MEQSAAHSSASPSPPASLYFGIGLYVSAHSRGGYWGTGAIDAICEQLQKELPGLRGFSPESVRKM